MLAPTPQCCGRRRRGLTHRRAASTYRNAPSSREARRASPMSRRRCFGSFSRQRRSTGAPRRASIDGSAVQSGSRSQHAASVSVTSSPSNARCARQHLVEHDAERPDVGALVDGSALAPAPAPCRRRCRGSCPSASCAGEVRVGELRATLAVALDAPAGSIAFARPKSSTFTVPSARTLMFAGFRSRWTMPCSCAASRASAICLAMRQRLVERDRAARDAACDRSSPSTSSITSARDAAAISSRP